MSVSGNCWAGQTLAGCHEILLCVVVVVPINGSRKGTPRIYASHLKTASQSTKILPLYNTTIPSPHETSEGPGKVSQGPRFTDEGTETLRDQELDLESQGWEWPARGWNPIFQLSDPRSSYSIP